jgi:SAM-dependent methyltransferase
MDPAYQQNQRAWNERVRRRQPYVDTATEADFRNPLSVVDQCGWLGDVTGKRLLCLAAGGGRHSVLFATAGARVTVLDLSPAMLDLDRKLAAERKLDIRVVEGSMDDLRMFEPASFDIVLQPVSTCYVPDVAAVYREVSRVTAPGGLYVSQHKQPVNLQVEPQATGRGYLLVEPYYRSGPLPPSSDQTWHREAGTLEFLHRWEQLLGRLCKAGFVIEDIAEPRHGDPAAQPGSFQHRSWFVPPYLKIKARRTNAPQPESTGPALWIPRT